jgi:hypothetical protein
MQRTVTAGVALTTAGTVGYVLGVLTPYPGRAFSLTGVFVGVTLLAVSGGEWS